MPTSRYAYLAALLPVAPALLEVAGLVLAQHGLCWKSVEITPKFALNGWYKPWTHAWFNGVTVAIFLMFPLQMVDFHIDASLLEGHLFLPPIFVMFPALLVHGSHFWWPRIPMISNVWDPGFQCWRILTFSICRSSQLQTSIHRGFSS